MSRSKFLLIALLTPLIFACCQGMDRLFTNRGYVQDTFVKLSSGDEIMVTAEMLTRFGKTEESRTSLVWKRGGIEKQLTELRQVDYQLPNRKASETHVSPDGNQVWLTHLGKTYASFDFDRAVAILGEKGHPGWAVNSAD